MLELVVYLALGADVARADGRAISWLVVVLSAPQAYSAWRRAKDAVPAPVAQEC